MQSGIAIGLFVVSLVGNSKVISEDADMKSNCARLPTFADDTTSLVQASLHLRSRNSDGTHSQLESRSLAVKGLSIAARMAANDTNATKASPIAGKEQVTTEGHAPSHAPQNGLSISRAIDLGAKLGYTGSSRHKEGGANHVELSSHKQQSEVQSGARDTKNEKKTKNIVIENHGRRPEHRLELKEFAIAFAEIFVAIITVPAFIAAALALLVREDARRGKDAREAPDMLVDDRLYDSLNLQPQAYTSSS